MRIALVHDFLTQYGGAERVLEELIEMFPNAPVFTLVYDKDNLKEFNQKDIRTSFIQRLPFGVKKYKWYLPLMPKAVESFNFEDFDLVISDASAFAKGVNVPESVTHICYCHTPTRYIWQEMDSYVNGLKYPRLIRRIIEFYVQKYLKNWDYRAAQKPDVLIANSRTVQQRIKKYYQRDSELVYPPVDTDQFNRRRAADGDYFIVVSRLEPYKKIDLAVKAARQLGIKLKVIGTGSQLTELKKLAGSDSSTEILGRVPDEKLVDYLSSAKALIFPALEDAGIVVLEALACGIPVIGYNKGGTAEFVEDRVHGILFTEQTTESVKQAIKRFKTTEFDRAELKKRANQFNQDNFRSQIQQIVNQYINKTQGNR